MDPDVRDIHNAPGLMQLEVVMKKRCIKILEYGVVVIPILIAVSEFILYKTSDLSLWKGGGFGMYSDPHPSTARHVWLIGENRGRQTYCGLYNMDARLDINRIQNGALREHLYDLGDYALDMRNFPSMTSKQKLNESYRQMLSELGPEPVDLSMIPREFTKLVVTELRISRDFRHIEMIPIYECPLNP